MNSKRQTSGNELQDALATKYPNPSKEWGWQYMFAAKNYFIDPRSIIERRHHA
jgi:hypothetical protein